MTLGGAGCNLLPQDNAGNTDNSNSDIEQSKPDDTDKDKPVTPSVEDSKEEFDEAVKKVGDFIEKMKTSQNFTLSQKSANGEPIVIKFDREDCEVTADNVTTYYSPMQDGKLYKIAKDSEGKWRKSECESAPYAVSDILKMFKNAEWESYENSKLTGKTIYNEQNAVISIKLSNGTCDYTLTYGGNTATGSISYVESTSVNLPEIEEEKPKDPVIDYDNLTEEQISQAIKIVKVKFATNIDQTVPANNKILAMEFGHDTKDITQSNPNSIQFLFNYTYNNKEYYDLVSFKSKSPITVQTIFEEPEKIEPATSLAGTRILRIAYTDNNEKTDAVFNKLYQDRIIYDKDEGKELVYTGEFDLQDLQEKGVGYVGFSIVDVYGLNEKQFVHISMQIRSDGATKDYITDNMINGKLIEYDPDKYEKGYFIGNWASGLFSQVYTFTDNALYDFNGLEKAS